MSWMFLRFVLACLASLVLSVASGASGSALAGAPHAYDTHAYSYDGSRIGASRDSEQAQLRVPLPAPGSAARAASGSVAAGRVAANSEG